MAFGSALRFTEKGFVRIVAPMRISTLTLSLLLGAFLAFPVTASAQETAAVEQEPTSGFVDRYTTAAQELVNESMNYLGIRYRFGGTSPETGLDCSGLVQAVFRNALGLDLPRTAHEMAGQGDKVSRQELKPGDLVFFNTMRRAFSHVGIYMGDGRFLHSPSSGGSVRIENMSTQYWAKRFNGARRLLDEDNTSTINASALAR